VSRERTLPRSDPAAASQDGTPAPAIEGLEFYLRRRLEGLLSGDTRTSMLGQGLELYQVRPYEPGDDVRWMEWNVTARTGEPHVRSLVAERTVTTLVLLDRSPSMTFGTADRRKADVAEGVVLAVSHLSTRRGNRLALKTFGESDSKTLPPRGGKLGLLGTLEALRSDPPRDGSGGGSLNETLRDVRALLRHRGVLVVVSDLRGPIDWGRSLALCAQQHEPIVVEVRDPREEVLPNVGGVWLVDPETGSPTFVDTANATLRRGFEAAATKERAEVRRAVLRSGARHVVLSTEGDWLHPFADAVSARRRRLP
jgi:uncharacterized protein (DUF58 family)